MRKKKLPELIDTILPVVKKPRRSAVRKITSIVKKTISRKVRKSKKKLPLVFDKHISNPILMPRTDYWWEAWQVFNPGAVLIDNKVHFLYRSIGEDGISRFGYADSEDGIDIRHRLSYPVYEHRLSVGKSKFFHNPSGGSWGGCEDPRLVSVDGDPNIYITYTACDGGLRMALTSINVDDFKQGKWNWSDPQFMSAPGCVNKNWVIFPEKINGKYAILHSISPKILVDYRDSLDFNNGKFIHSHYANDESRKECWDGWVRGVGAPPVKTDLGWLLFYHAMDHNDPNKYKVGVMVLDLKDPTKILYRSKYPVLEPDEDYENNGFKSGVVYLSGAVVKDDTLFVYYGGADSYVCVAYAKLDEFLNEIKKDLKPKLKRKYTRKSK